jgi:hypothetical protein
MLHSRQEFVTELEMGIIRAQLADLICCRCKLRYRDHAAADHLFFYNPEDIPFEERN